jgi:hypothetical protein
MIFEGLTLTALILESTKTSGAIAIPVSIIIALLRPCKARSRLALIWILLPASAGAVLTIMGIVLPPVMLVGISLLITVAPLWAVFAAATYFLVLWLRRFSNDLDRKSSG